MLPDTVATSASVPPKPGPRPPAHLAPCWQLESAQRKLRDRFWDTLLELVPRQYHDRLILCFCRDGIRAAVELAKRQSVEAMDLARRTRGFERVRRIVDDSYDLDEASDVLREVARFYDAALARIELSQGADVSNDKRAA